MPNKPNDLNENNAKSYANGDFNFDLELMEKAVNAPSVTAPRFDTPEEFLEWLDNLTDEDFV